ncbi:MAG: Type 1 glutamine amidotransferase-like domain-containing protein [Patescibacteria group bacterium]
MNLFLASSVNFVAIGIADKVRTITKNNRLVFITTASEVEKGDLSWLDDDRQALKNAGFLVEDFSITGKNQEQILGKFNGAGSVCVAGGNTYYLLDQVRKSGFDKIINSFVNNGLMYIGSSAGSLLAGPNIETSLDDPKITPELIDYTGLNLIDVAVRPHWGSEHFIERYHQEMDRLYSLKQNMILLRDNQYLYVKESWYQVITCA